MVFLEMQNKCVKFSKEGVGLIATSNGDNGILVTHLITAKDMDFHELSVFQLPMILTIWLKWGQIRLERTTATWLLCRFDRMPSVF